MLSKNHLKLRLTRATKEILFFLSLTDMAILHRDQYSKDTLKVQDWAAITSGAYRVTFNADKKLVLVANERSLNYSNKIDLTPKNLTMYNRTS